MQLWAQFQAPGPRHLEEIRKPQPVANRYGHPAHGTQAVRPSDRVRGERPDCGTCTQWRSTLDWGILPSVDAWVALLGAVAGATIAIVGRYVARRSEVRERAVMLLLEQCAEVVALAEDYRNRVWEERNSLSNDAVATRNISAYQLAEARLRILCRAPSLVSALDALRKAGITLGRTWRLSRSEARTYSRRGKRTVMPSTISLRPAGRLFDREPGTARARVPT